MTAPRLRVDLDKVTHNTRVLVDRLGPLGIDVLGVTKSVLAAPEVAEAMVRGGVAGLADSRIQNLATLRAAGIAADLTLIRTPMLSECDRVVELAGTSFNSEVAVLDALAAAAGRRGTIHGVVLMVELGDLREGVGVDGLHDLVRATLRHPSLRLRGLGTNLACRSGVVPDRRNMGDLSRLASSVESAFGIELDVVSGGNSATLDWALRLVVVLASPAAVGMLCFAGPMTAMILGYKAFDAEDVQRTSYALMAYSWGLLGFSFVKVLVPGYFARQDTKRPVRIALIALAVATSLNVLVVIPAARLGFPQPHILIATATCIGAAVNTTLLWRGLVRAGVLKPAAGWRVLLLRVVAANAVMGALLVWLAGDTARWMQMELTERLLRCGGGIALAALVYFAVLFLLGLRQRHLRSVPG
jgi:hypothetical protein